MILGEGPRPADLMVIGEAPGRQEIAQGRPFVGPSGRLLEFLLVQNGILREEVFITNVYREMPLDDDGKIRRPYPTEIEEHDWILREELASVRPRAILLLGSTAYRAMTKDWDSRVPWGTIFLRNEVPCGTIWHPSYLLRRGEREFPQWREQARPLFEALGDA